MSGIAFTFHGLFDGARINIDSSGKRFRGGSDLAISSKHVSELSGACKQRLGKNPELNLRYSILSLQGSWRRVGGANFREWGKCIIRVYISGSS